MKTGRRGFLKALLGTSAGVAASGISTTALALPEKVKVEVKRKIQGMTKEQIIEMLLSNTPLYLGESFGDTPLDAPAKISEGRKTLLRQQLGGMSRTELIVHAEEFYGLLIKDPTQIKGERKC